MNKLFINGNLYIDTDATIVDDPDEDMSQEPCDYCPFEGTDKCNEDNCKCMTYGIPVVDKKEKGNE